MCLRVVCKLCLSVQVGAIAVCLSLPSYTPSLSLSPVQSSSTLFTSTITLLASLISLLHIALLSPHNKLPLPYTLVHTCTLLPSPYCFPHTILSSLSLSLYLFPHTTTFHLPFPSPLPHCRISSSFLTCQVVKFTMAYRRHFGSGLHVPTKKGKSFV